MDQKMKEPNQENKKMNVDELLRVSGGIADGEIWYCPICDFSSKKDDEGVRSILKHMESHFDAAH